MSLDNVLLPIPETYLVLRDETEKITDEGIHVPGEAKKTGIVKAVGENLPPCIQAGTRVQWMHEPMGDFKINGVNYLAFSGTEIIVVLPPEDE
jgi:co-chaperonin GroES (HSP10)